MQASRQGTGRDHGLDVLKVIATVLIIFHHYQQEFTLTFPGINFYGGSFYFGMMVELFFIISGCLMVSYIDRIKDRAVSFGQFMKRRLLRFIPLVGIAAVVSQAMLYIYMLHMGHMDYAEHGPTLWGIIIDTLCIQSGGVFTNPYVNNPTWYISILVICYAWFYLLTRAARRLRICENYLFAGMIFLGFAINTYGFNLPFAGAPAARGYVPFFWGVLFGRCLLPRLKGCRKAGAVSACIIAVMTFLIARQNILVANDIKYLMTFLYYPALIVLFESAPAGVLFAPGIWESLGKSSFNAFIWHVPGFIFVRILLECLGLPLDLMYSRKAMLLYAVIIFIVGALSHRFLEQPVADRLSGRHRSRINAEHAE